MVESYLPKALSPCGVREGIMLFTCVHFWAGCTPDKLTSPSHYILMQEIFTGNVNRKLETLFQREQLNNKVGYLCIQPWQTYGQNVQTDVFLQPCVVKKRKITITKKDILPGGIEQSLRDFSRREAGNVYGRMLLMEVFGSRGVYTGVTPHPTVVSTIDFILLWWGPHLPTPSY